MVETVQDKENAEHRCTERPRATSSKYAWDITCCGVLVLGCFCVLDHRSITNHQDHTLTVLPIGFHSPKIQTHITWLHLCHPSLHQTVVIKLLKHSYFSVAVIKRPEKSNLQEKWLILVTVHQSKDVVAGAWGSHSHHTLSHETESDGACVQLSFSINIFQGPSPGSDATHSKQSFSFQFSQST